VRSNDARNALQSVRLRCSPRGVSAQGRPLGISCPFKVSSPTRYLAYWFRDPTLPLAVSPALWFSLAVPRRPQLSERCVLSSGFAFLQSLAQHNLARQPQPPSTSHGLLLPTALEDLEIHLPRALPSPATVRLQGLATLLTAYALRARAGFVSHRRRSWDSPFGAFSFRKVSAAFPGGRTRVPFLPSVIPPPKRWAGPTGRGFRAFTLPGVPGDRRSVSTATAGCSHGLHPSRVCWRTPGPGFHPAYSHALCGRRPYEQRRRRPGASISLRLAPSAARQAEQRKGQPF
jgi:hypothetical protein